VNKRRKIGGGEDVIGIHDSPGTYSDRWILYCEEHGIPFRRVDCFSTDVVSQCQGLAGLLWHWLHYDPRGQLVARQVITSLQSMGLLVFPNTGTCWHYDDKIAQKYLLEAIHAPLIPTWVFTSETDARRWIEEATWPKVFKLRSGAGSTNVRLVQSAAEAGELCRQAFGEGFSAVSGYSKDLRSRIGRAKSTREFVDKLTRAPRSMRNVRRARRELPRERGYVYFQEFLAGNDFDTRITIIGNRAFGFTRTNRPSDFRASGSGRLSYDAGRIDPRCIEIGFRVAELLGSQSLAFDFLFNSAHEPMIGEISYSYVSSAVNACGGYWDRQGGWHEEHVWPEDAILHDFLASLARPRQ
jgi:glutathione synthase/RimK-type ligase-like ATP-grasp enzyme